jgi:hypothetical protein
MLREDEVAADAGGARAAEAVLAAVVAHAGAVATLCTGALPLPTAVAPFEVVAACARALSALRVQRHRAERRARLPPNVGKPWSAAHDALLLAGFDAGLTPDELAARVGRTRAGIRSRLVRHGRLPPPVRS